MSATTNGLAGWTAATPSRQVIAAVVVVAAVILGSFGYDQQQRYEEALALADRDTRNAAVLVAESMTRTFEDIDATLGAVSLLQRDADAGVSRDKATLFRLMRIINDTSPAISAIGWFDAEGDLTVSSRSPERLNVNIADREYFIGQREGTVKGLYVTAPVQSRASGEWIIAVSRRLEHSDGRFAGVVSAIIDPAHFASVFRAVELGPGRVGALFRADGTVLAREPQLKDRLGRSAATAAWFREQVPGAPSGTYRGPNVFDGSERILSFAKVGGGEQVVSVSVPRSEALAPFFRNLARSGTRYGILLLLLFASTWLLVVQLRRRQRADGRFRDLLEAAPEAMVIAEPSGRIALVNAQTEKLFGYRRDEVIGQSVEMLMPERYRDQHGAKRDDFTARPRLRPMGSGLALQGLRKDGSEFPLEISLSPLQTEEGLLVSAAIRDITAQKKAEADLVEARRVETEASRAKSDFLSSMSHELRTPLNAVIGFAQMLELDRARTLTDSQKEYVGYINSSGHHLLNLVNEVLDLAGVESGRLKLSIERVSVRNAVESVRATMSRLAQQAGVTFEIDITAAVDHVCADDLRLRQTLINLISNAIKYNRPGGSVSLTVTPMPAGTVRFAVKDTGIGIAPARQKDLFEPFQRLGAEFTSIEGTGIGLALSRRIVEAMGGMIGFTSEPGKGSEFWIDLPSVSLDAHAAAPAPSVGALPRALASGFSMLYVEDNPVSIRLIEHLVSTLPNVALLTAATPQLGIDMAVAHRPDVIVLDLNLPGMSGYQVLARLQALPETLGIPVLALSAAAFPSDVRKGMAAGFFRYLTKPLDVNAFLAAVADALADASRRRASSG